MSSTVNYTCNGCSKPSKKADGWLTCYWAGDTIHICPTCIPRFEAAIADKRPPPHADLTALAAKHDLEIERYRVAHKELSEKYLALNAASGTAAAERDRLANNARSDDEYAASVLGEFVRPERRPYQSTVPKDARAYIQAAAEELTRYRNQAIEEFARLEKAEIALSDARDEVELTEHTVIEVIGMLGKKSRKKHARRIHELELACRADEAPSPSSHESLVSALKSSAIGPPVSMQELLRRAQEQRPTYVDGQYVDGPALTKMKEDAAAAMTPSGCDCTNGCKALNCENM